MTTLFSPVGTADPITIQGDGPMLHIVRHRKPDKVVLFFSPKMWGYQVKDERYTKAIERMCAAEGRAMPIIERIHSDYEKVFQFDYYIEEFEHVLEGLCEDCPDEPVLVNASSGTPAWQQALVALGSFGRLSLELLQVVTPRHDINKQDDRENPDTYDFEEMWGWNEELRVTDPKTKESRISVVQTPSFRDRVMRENVITLLKSYAYEAAYELAIQTNSINDEVRLMIRAAADRLNLDGALPARVFAKTPLAYRPNDILGEHLSVMEVRLEQGHWADFIRLLTPAFVHLARKELRRNGLPESKYLIIEMDPRTNRRSPSGKLNLEAIEQDEQLRRVLRLDTSDIQRCINQQRPLYISDEMLTSLVREFCPDGPEKDKLVALRGVDKECRNIVAHELQASSKESIEKHAKLPLETILQYLFDLHGNVRPHLYEEISQEIVKRI